MNCLAIDDEPLALNVISEFCEKFEFLHLVGKCTSAIDAISVLNENDIDLIFLDIHMPHISGLEFLKTLESPPMVIFTTAYSEHALDGFDLNAIDYLVKPISFERFIKAINKAYELSRLKKGNTRNNISDKEYVSAELQQLPTSYLMVKVEYSTVRVDLDTILYIEGLKDYIRIFTEKKHVMTKCTMKNIEERLPENNFIRVHKSFIVAMSKIEAITNNRIRIGEKYIPIGKQYKADFYKILDEKRL